MSEIGQVLAFAAQLYGEKARIVYSGYVRRDLMAQLHLRLGRADPYPIYEHIRERGTLVPARVDGDWTTASPSGHMLAGRPMCQHGPHARCPRKSRPVRGSAESQRL